MKKTICGKLLAPGVPCLNQRADGQRRCRPCANVDKQKYRARGGERVKALERAHDRKRYRTRGVERRKGKPVEVTEAPWIDRRTTFGI